MPRGRSSIEFCDFVSERGAYHETRLPVLVNGQIVTFSGKLQNTGSGSIGWGVGKNKNKHTYGGCKLLFLYRNLNF